MNCGPLELLSPPKDCCQECAIKHHPSQPHNPRTFYYQYNFLIKHKRPATWSDAMAHCNQEVKDKWLSKLKKLNIDVSSTNITGNIKSEQEVRDRDSIRNLSLFAKRKASPAREKT